MDENDIVIINNIDSLNDKILDNSNNITKILSNIDKSEQTQEKNSIIFNNKIKKQKEMDNELLLLIENQTNIIKVLEEKIINLENKNILLEQKISCISEKNNTEINKLQINLDKIDCKIDKYQKINSENLKNMYNELDSINISQVQKNDLLKIENNIKNLNNSVYLLDISIKDMSKFYNKKIFNINENLQLKNEIDDTIIKERIDILEDNVYLSNKRNEISKIILNYIDNNNKDCVEEYV